MNQWAKEMALAHPPELDSGVTIQAPPAPRAQAKAPEHSESLFERFAWLYIFCREKLFRDDTKRIIAALWPDGEPERSSNLIELGCGPGFYSCRLASRYPQMSVLGVDRSPKQLNWASEKARTLRLDNCTFERVNVLALSHVSHSFDNLVASRLLTILPAREKAVAEMFRILRPGGRCFVAEPRYTFWASLPLFAMWMLAGLTQYGDGYREPRKALVLAQTELERLFATQPWKSVKTWQDGRYQYALCEKG